MKERTKVKLIDIVFFISMLILFSAEVLPRNLSNLDEIWNFNFARNIANGLLPYNDFNMLQTPLLSFIMRRNTKNFWTRIIRYENRVCIFGCWNNIYNI